MLSFEWLKIQLQGQRYFNFIMTPYVESKRAGLVF